MLDALSLDLSRAGRRVAADVRAAILAIVTGAARGIGAATGRPCSRPGWHVLAVDVAANDPALPYGWHQGTTRAVVADCAAPDSSHAFVADVRDLDALHARSPRPNSAGAGSTPRSPWPASSPGGVPHPRCRPTQEHAVLDVNLVGVLNLARAARSPPCSADPNRGTGRFLAVASAAATRGLPTLAAYCAAKAGVTGLVRALAVELGGSPASRPTRSARARPTPRCWRRRPGSTACRPRVTSPSQQPIGRLVEPTRSRPCSPTWPVPTRVRSPVR